MAMVYSQQRAGKPRLAILGSVVLLGLTIALAYAVMVQKDRLYSVSLGPEKAYPEGRLRARLPADWESLDPDDSPPGTLAAVSSPDDHYADQSLYLLRGLSADLPPKQRALAVMGQFISEAYSDLQPRREMTAVSGYGPWPSWTISLSLWRLPVDENIFSDPSVIYPEVFLLGRVISLPNGETVAVVLASDEVPLRRDENILERVARNVQILGAHIAESPEEVLERVGIRFSLPADSRVIVPPDATIPQVRLMVGEGNDYWDATLTRVPLINGRTPEHLVADVVLESDLAVELSEPIEFVEEAERTIAYAGFGKGAGKGSDLHHCYCAAIDAQTALLIEACGEKGAIEELKAECARLADEAEVDSITTWIDVAAAEEQAAYWLRQVELAGLDTDLTDMISKGRILTIYDPGRVERGFLSYGYRPSDEDERWWEIPFHMEYSIVDGVLITQEETALIRNDGQAHRGKLRIAGRKFDDIDYTESRMPGGVLTRWLLVAGQGEYEEEIQPSETYASQALLEHIYPMMARKDEAEPALFMSTTIFGRGEHAWIVYPLGEREVPWTHRAAENAKARAVRAYQDYDPEYFDAYYGEDGQWLGVMFSDGHWYEAGRPSKRRGGDLMEYLRQLWNGEAEGK